MNLPNHLCIAAICRALLTVFAAAVVLATTGCGGSGNWPTAAPSEPDWRSSHRTLEAKFLRLRSELADEQKESEKTSFWRTISASLGLLVFFALFGGAALGSRARRDRLAHSEEPNHPDDPTTDEVVC